MPHALDVIVHNLESNGQVELLALHDALDVLADISPRQRQVVECRFFGGLTVDQTAKFLQVSVGTVERDWRIAKTTLYRELRHE